jgi:hypothetical protein
MSLTSFIKRPEVRAGFRSAISKPAFKCNAPLLAPPLTKRYGLVGGAFDYLLRFFIERHNQHANSYTWVAYLGLTLLPDNSRLYRLAARRLKEAEKHHATFLKTGIVSDDLLASALYLAAIDVIFRAGPGVIRVEHLDHVDPLDIEDLKALTSIVPIHEFTALQTCLLNPSFGSASQLVGGADADVIIDDTLVEVKTTKYLTLDRSYIDQLIGYHLLLKLNGISSCLPTDFNADEYELNHIGVYFARHGYFYRVPISEVIDPNALPAFAKWFVEIACPSRRERAAYYKRFTWVLCRNWLDELRTTGRLQKADRAERPRLVKPVEGLSLATSKAVTSK